MESLAIRTDDQMRRALGIPDVAVVDQRCLVARQIESKNGSVRETVSDVEIPLVRTLREGGVAPNLDARADALGAIRCIDPDPGEVGPVSAAVRRDEDLIRKRLGDVESASVAEFGGHVDVSDAPGLELDTGEGPRFAKRDEQSRAVVAEVDSHRSDAHIEAVDQVQRAKRHHHDLIPVGDGRVDARARRVENQIFDDGIEGDREGHARTGIISVRHEAPDGADRCAGVVPSDDAPEVLGVLLQALGETESLGDTGAQLVARRILGIEQDVVAGRALGGGDIP